MSFRFPSVLSSHLPSGIPRRLLPSFQDPYKNPVCISLSFMRATFAVHHILLDLSVKIIHGENTNHEATQCAIFIQRPINETSLGSNILSSLFSNIRSVHPSHHAVDQFSHSHETKGKNYRMPIASFDFKILGWHILK